MIRVVGPPLKEKPSLIEDVVDPVELERGQRQHEQALRNLDWLSSHWHVLLPGALGKFVAVAGQQAFVADTSDDAYALAVAAHPEDKGMLIQYVSPEKGDRIYANRRALGVLP
jgi:hypothetical protein